MDELCSVLRVPPEYLRTCADTTLLLCTRDWVREFSSQDQVPTVFPSIEEYSASEIQAVLAERRVPAFLSSWILLEIQIIKIKNENVFPFGEGLEPSDYLSYPESLNFVNQCNTRNLTNQARKQYNQAGRSTKTPESKPWYQEFVRLLRTLYPASPVIDLTDTFNELLALEFDDDSRLQSYLPLRFSVLTESIIILSFDVSEHNLGSVTRFSPGFLSDNQAKLLFIVYQLVNIVKTYQDLGVYISELQLKDFTITQTLHVAHKPKFLENLVVTPSKPETKDLNVCIETDSICDKVLGWVQGRVSNLEYILYLNQLSGRRFGDPNFHPVVPWVTDFTSRNGKLRDLTKSKFRLNKGDELLDRTYESGDHHVTAVLSEITYYTYLARRTDNKVLCKYVRPSWVPEEYPRSIQRLQEWSPDEAIPEFYQDSSVFSSIHSDLPDLELPDWISSPDDFIIWHRSILESEEVSRHLHSWIDLTFGYKLSGSAAIRNKNVCLDFSENQRDLRVRGVLQLFSQPHPIRQKQKPVIANPIPTVDLSNYDDPDPGTEEGGTGGWDPPSKILIPPEFHPAADVSVLESLNTFLFRAFTYKFKDKDVTDEKVGRNMTYLLKVKSMQILGCLISELFHPRKFRALGDQPSFETRYRNSVDLMIREEKTVPLCIRGLLKKLLLVRDLTPFDLEPSDRFPAVSEQGLPLPSAELLLDPILSGYFPTLFAPFLQTISAIETLNNAAEYIEDSDALESLSEFQVKLVARRISPLIQEAKNEHIELVLPLYCSLIYSSRTAVQACWHLLDKISVSLGPERTQETFLASIVSHYKNIYTTKHVKLYHRSFILVLMARLRLSVFLDSFSYILIEATGGNREFSETPVPTPSDQPQSLLNLEPEPSLTYGEVFSFDSWDSLGSMKTGLGTDTISSVAQNLKQPGADSIDVHASVVFRFNDEDASSLGRRENSVVQISKETLLWLPQRLGPVLTAKHITRNLLRMMSLCYLPPEGLEPTDQYFPDQQIRISPAMLTGDSLSLSVLECLKKIAELYGDHFILVQYLPWCWDLAGLCRRKITPNLEGGLLGALAVLHSVIPLLSDSILMKELDNITSQILCPVIHAATSSQNSFTSGPQVRSALLLKSLDVLYLLGLRIGEEMSRTHLNELAIGVFSAFSKVFEDVSSEKSANFESPQTQKIQLSTELAEVLTKKLAYSIYISFYFLLGGTYLEETVPNICLIKKLCLEYQSGLTGPMVRPYTYREIQRTLPHQSNEASFSGSGNMIIVKSADEETDNTSEISKLIHAPAGNTSRHLRGNWLAYWEHELSRGENDGFNLKQIRLQNWTGHQGSVKSISVLDNENSFISGGKDRTVRLWSLRSSGEGEHSGTAQWVYSGHKKSVFSVGYLAQKGYAVSCDGSIHIWDPYVGSLTHEYDGSRGNPFCVMTPQTYAHSIVAASTEGNLALIDTRVKNVADLKVSYGLVGLIRSVCASEDGNHAAIGHSSGYISLIDLRSGKIRSGMKAHDGEVLTLTSGDSYFVSTSLDQTAHVYQWEDSKLWTHLRTPPEPLHCVATYQDQIITGSTNHKVSVHSIFRDRESNTVVSKLRSDIIRGNLIQMEILPLNRLLLLGTDVGSIHLIC